MDAVAIAESYDKIYKFIRLPGEERSEFCFGVTDSLEKTKSRLRIDNIFEQECGTAVMASFVVEKMQQYGFKIDNTDGVKAKAKNVYAYLYKISEKEKKEVPVEKSAIELVKEERERQIKEEGFGPEHDDKWVNGELANAASCYAMTDDAINGLKRLSGVPMHWPFDNSWWKRSPDDRIRDLVKSAALAIAEIERLRRIKK